MLKKLDHLVITTADVSACLGFYSKLGFTARDAGGRYELYAGDFKLNVHLLGRELLPHAHHVQPGSADLCLEIDGDIAHCKAELERSGLTIEQGVVPRNGVRGPMQSIYLRDPDGNLVELCSYN